MSKKQIGGSHYKKYAISPWTFIRENLLNPFQANVIRYVVRYEDKNGIEDLQKIIHYCEMEIDFIKKKKKKRELLPDDSPIKEEEWAAMIAQMQDA
jgi:hypothetical protein|tara:strand:- start:565 stop:852 length:288 start_codon:yes stop_codon:yes gene_type:complete